MFTFHHVLGTNFTEVRQDGLPALVLSRTYNVFANDGQIFITAQSRLLNFDEAEHQFSLAEIDFANCVPAIETLDLETQLNLFHLTFFGEHSGVVAKKSVEAIEGALTSDYGVVTEYGSPSDRVSFTNFQISEQMPVNSGFTLYCKSSKSEAQFSNSAFNQTFGEYEANRLLKVEYYRSNSGAGEYLIYPVNEVPVAQEIVFLNNTQDWPGLDEPAYVSGAMVSIEGVLGDDGMPLRNYEAIMEVNIEGQWQTLPSRKASMGQPYILLPFMDELERLVPNAERITRARVIYRYFDGIHEYPWVGKLESGAPFVPLRRLDDANYINYTNFVVRNGDLLPSLDGMAFLRNPGDGKLFVTIGDELNHFINGGAYVLLLCMRSSQSSIRVKVSGGGFFEGGNFDLGGIPSDHLKQFVLHKSVTLPPGQAGGKIEILAEDLSDEDFIHFRVMVAETL